MATTEELYISLDIENYKINKSNILICQASLLETLKRLHKLKVLSRQKRDLKIKLYKLITSTLSEIDSIQKNMPTPAVPKNVHKTIETKSKGSFSMRDDIEDELKLIQEKLRELNS